MKPSRSTDEILIHSLNNPAALPCIHESTATQPHSSALTQSHNNYHNCNLLVGTDYDQPSRPYPFSAAFSDNSVIEEKTETNETYQESLAARRHLQQEMANLGGSTSQRTREDSSLYTGEIQPGIDSDANVYTSSISGVQAQGGRTDTNLHTSSPSGGEIHDGRTDTNVHASSLSGGEIHDGRTDPSEAAVAEPQPAFIISKSESNQQINEEILEKIGDDSNALRPPDIFLTKGSTSSMECSSKSDESESLGHKPEHHHPHTRLIYHPTLKPSHLAQEIKNPASPRRRAQTLDKKLRNDLSVDCSSDVSPIQERRKTVGHKGRPVFDLLSDSGSDLQPNYSPSNQSSRSCKKST